MTTFKYENINTNVKISKKTPLQILYIFNCV